MSTVSSKVVSAIDLPALVGTTAPDRATALGERFDLIEHLPKEAGEAQVILFGLSGHGHFDLSSYERYLNGALEDYEYPADRVAAALERLPKV